MPAPKIIVVEEGAQIQPKKPLDDEVRAMLTELSDEKGDLSQKVYALVSFDAEGEMDEVFQVRPWRKEALGVALTEAPMPLLTKMRAKFARVRLPYTDDKEPQLIAYADEVVVRDPLSLLFHRYFIVGQDEFQKLKDKEAEAVGSTTQVSAASAARAYSQMAQSAV